MLLIFAVTFIFLVGAMEITDNSYGDFNNGTYSWTFYNTSGFVQLNSSRLDGTFISKIFNTNGLTQWNNISWTTSAVGELPGNQEVETKFTNGNANMTGNVLLMHMDETSGTIVDSSGSGNNGAAYSGVEYGVNGEIGKALKFDKTGTSYVEVPNSNGLNPGTNDFTISVWFKLNSAGSTNGHILYNKENLYEMSAGGGYVTYAWRPHWAWDGGSSFPINVGKWYQAVLVYDHSKQYLYKNGILVYSRSQTGNIGTNSNRFALATRGTSGGGRSAFDGTIDEVAIYNRSLSAQEVLDDYKRGAEKLNLSVRSCNDASCSGESWTNLGNGLISPQNLSETNNQYFQYKYDFSTSDSSYTPELYNVSIDYTLLDVTPPNTTIDAPINNTLTSLQNLNFNFTSIENYPGNFKCSLYLDGILNQTNYSVVNNTLTNFKLLGISGGSHNWSVTCTDRKSVV